MILFDCLINIVCHQSMTMTLYSTHSFQVDAFKILSHIIIYMNCTVELHDELSQNYRNCPFCEHRISDYYTDKQSNC